MTRGITIPLIFFTLLSHAQERQYVYDDGAGGESELEAATIYDDNLLLGLNCFKKYSYDPQALLVLLNPELDTIWTHLLGENVELVDLAVLDRDILVLTREGTTASVSLFDQSLKLLWSRASDLEYPSQMSIGPKNEIIVVGTSEGGDENETLSVWKMSSKGKDFGINPWYDGEKVKVYDLAISLKGEVAITGVVDERGEPFSKLWMFDSKSENMILDLELNGLSFKYPFTVSFDQKEQLVVGGDHTDGVAVLVKLKRDGSKEWIKSLDGPAGQFRIYAISTTGSNRYLAVGRTNDAKGFLAQFDLDGKITFYKEYEGLGKAGLQKVLSYEGNIYLAGTTLNRRSKPSGFVVRAELKD